MKLPRTLDDITPEWLTEAMSGQFPGARVTSVRPLQVTASTATKARLGLTYVGDPAGIAPHTVVAKGGLFGHPHEESLQPLYRNEALFYRDVAPSVDIELPRCFAAVTDQSSGLVVLDDLVSHNVRFGEGRAPLHPDEVAAALEYQASYHAHFWDRPAELEKLGLMDLSGFLRDFFSGLAPHFEIESSHDHNEPTLRAVRDAQEIMQDRTRFADAVRKVWTMNEDSPPCLIHFDTHLGNMYFDHTGAARWLDWQLCGRGCWAWDVAYFIIGSLTPDDRGAHEHDLLDHYRGALGGHGVTPPDRDEAWLAYRRNAIWGLSWTLVPEVMQAHENRYPIIARFLQAVRELETMAALDLPAGGKWS